MGMFIMPLFIFADSITLDVRIMANWKLSSVIITPLHGHYSVIHQNTKITGLGEKSVLTVTVSGKKLKIKKSDGSLGTFDSLWVKAEGADDYIEVKGEKKTRKYDDHLLLTVLQGGIQIINRVDLENYVAGVMQGESADCRHPEYYKIQACISRTYALMNMRKHELDGFQQCDLVHCQVFRGHCTRPDILEAVNATRGLVIVDSAGALINAAFHCNSGGQTANSEDVWSKPAPYLKSVDSFSDPMPNAVWKKRIPQETWLNYLKTKHHYPIFDTVKRAEALQYHQSSRKVYFGDTIPLKMIRNDMNLKSTYFDIVQDGKDLIFKGRGFGHGVGLSQEGALNMARFGFTFEQIISFYYKNVRIVKLDSNNLPKMKKLKNGK